MKCCWPYLLLLLCTLCSIPGEAVTGRLYTPDRLSSSLFTCICQDRYGYVWIGTEYGLNRFDGYHFYSYTHSRTDATTLTDNEVSTLFVDRDGQLWVGCSRGLVRYDYEHDCFNRFRFPDDRRPRISALLQDADGRLLVGTAGYGLYTLSPSDSLLHYEARFSRRHADDFYSRMHLDRQGNLWRSSHLPTLTKFSIKNGQPTALCDYQTTCGMPMRFIDYGPDSLLVVCMHGIMSYNYRTGDLSSAGFDLSALPSGVSIEDAMLTHQGDLYIATAGSGLMKIARGSSTLTRVEHTSSHIDLNTANVVEAMEDKDHNLWVACYNKGLMLLSDQQAPFSTWSLSSQRYLTGGGVSSITAGDADDTWCTVQNSGVYGLDSLGRITAHPSSPAGTRLIFRDRKGRYWLTTDNVLYRYDPRTGQADTELTLNGRGLNNICDDGQGRLYIGVFGQGLYVYDPTTRQGELLSMQQTSRRGGYLLNDWIKALCLDSRGMLWICTTNGLAMMHPDGNVFNSRGWNALLEGTQCYAVCEAADGSMLVGTENGLYRYDWKRNQIEEASGTEALHDKMICAMVTDRKGQVWIATSMGIWQYSQQSDGKPLLIGHVADNGLMAREFMLAAVAHHSDGRISFGTADGMVTFHPRDVSWQTRRLGAARLTRFTMGRRTLNPTQQYYELQHHENSFTLDFSLLDYKNAENISFQYRLNGSKTWQQTNEGSNQLTFVQLSPGSYTLDVRAAAGGLASDTVTTIHIRICQPWYKTWWAFVLYVLAAAGFGGLLLFSWRSYQEEKRLHVTINALTDNMRWLRGKFIGSLEQKGDIEPIKVKGNNDVLMERVVKCVNENLSNPDFSVELLTRQVGVSRAQLHRKMKEMTGQSTSEFIRDLRLKQAAQLISEHKINITQVAYSVGFNNQAHFSTVFKKHYGMTPTEYAEKNP